jgi:hypothetical protein
MGRAKAVVVSDLYDTSTTAAVIARAPPGRGLMAREFIRLPHCCPLGNGKGFFAWRQPFSSISARSPGTVLMVARERRATLVFDQHGITELVSAVAAHHSERRDLA